MAGSSSSGSKIWTQSSADDEFLMNRGSGIFGCSHFRRRCKIRAPCCDEMFSCRFCHDDAKDSLEVELANRHKLPRHEVKRVICSLCDTEQDVQQKCIHCGVCMGKYYCSECKFFDDDVSKNLYHCDECGICRAGGKENFFHCKKCEYCYPNVLQDSHICLEGAMHRNCPICLEYLSDSMKAMTVLRCGHPIHLECFKDMKKHLLYSCPLCLKSYCDMSAIWRHRDEEVALITMPGLYPAKTVWILCNDCGGKSEIKHHILGLKCGKCPSYNTREIERGGPSC